MTDEDKKKVLAAVTEIGEDKIALAIFDQIASDAEVMPLKIVALATAIASGSIYKLQNNGIKNFLHYAQMQATLETLQEAGKHLERAARQALTGENGHALRLAEFMAEQKQTELDVPKLGKVVITETLVILPPSKEHKENYEKFQEWCKQVGIAYTLTSGAQGFEWKAFQTLVKQYIDNKAEVPPFITVRTQKEARFK